MAYPTLTPLPTPPSPDAPATFNTLAYPFTQAQVTLAAQINTLVAQLNATFFPDSPVLAMISGTAALPVYSRNGDPDTGIFFPAANTLAFTTAGVESLRLTSAGLLTSATAITQSATDITNGRLWVNSSSGMFGLGNRFTAPLLTSWDAIDTPSGNYHYTSSGTSGSPPPGASTRGIVVIERAFNNALRQIVTENTGATRSARIWTRDYSAARPSEWSRWVQIYTQDSAVGTVSYADGANTGAIVESGLNANGAFVRYADGTQICRFGTTIPNTGSTWVFPAEFITPPNVVGSIITMESVVLCLDTNPTNTSCAISGRGPDGTRRATSGHLIAMGRWRA